MVIYAWEQRKLEDLANRYDNLRVPVSAINRVAGDIPYYGANGIQDYVDGYTHNGEFILVAEDGANDLKNYPVQYVNGYFWANNHTHVLQAKPTKANNLYLKYCISNTNIENLLVGGGRAKLNANVLMEIPINKPTNTDEQTQIGNLFYKIDTLITLHQRKSDKFTKLTRASKKNLVFKNCMVKLPKITDAWEQRKYEDIGYSLSGGNLSYNDLNEDGINKCILYGELYTQYDTVIKDIVNRTNKFSRTIYKNDILFPQSTTVDALSLISPACMNEEKAETGGVFIIRPYKNIDGNFIAYYTKGNNQQRLKLSKKAQGLTIVHLYYQSIKDETLFAPKYEEQTQISQLLLKLDNLITLHQRE